MVKFFAAVELLLVIALSVRWTVAIANRKEGLQCARLYDGRNYEGPTKELSQSRLPDSLEGDWSSRAQSAVVKDGCLLTGIDAKGLKRTFENEIYCLWKVSFIL